MLLRKRNVSTGCREQIVIKWTVSEKVERGSAEKPKREWRKSKERNQREQTYVKIVTKSELRKWKDHRDKKWSENVEQESGEQRYTMERKVERNC